MTQTKFKPILLQAAFVGAAAGNIMSAPIIGHGSAIWFVFVFLMFVAMAAMDGSFARLLALAVLSVPVLCFWQSLHRFQPSTSFLVVEFGFVVLASQAAAACVFGYRKYRTK